jgi:hypothetical protein
VVALGAAPWWPSIRHPGPKWWPSMDLRSPSYLSSLVSFISAKIGTAQVARASVSCVSRGGAHSQPFPYRRLIWAIASLPASWVPPDVKSLIPAVNGTSGAPQAIAVRIDRHASDMQASTFRGLTARSARVK